MKKPGWRASCSCNVVVALFMAPITTKSGRWITILMIHPAETRSLGRSMRPTNSTVELLTKYSVDRHQTTPDLADF